MSFMEQYVFQRGKLTELMLLGMKLADIICNLGSCGIPVA